MKILAVIENDTYIRNFVLAGAFSELEKNPDFKYCLSNMAIKLTHLMPQDKIVGSYERSEYNKSQIFIFNQIAMRAMRKKSSTLDIKFQAYKYKLKDKAVYEIFSKPPLFKQTKKLIKNRLRPNPSLEELIKKFKPEIVIFPFTGVEATGNELILISKKYKFKTLFLVNGWDNLSSKGVLLLNPDFLGVWGPQSILDAVQIQGMDPSGIFMLGCSRYDVYYKPNAAAKKSMFPYKYILFAGATTANDEITPLLLLDKTMQKLKIKNTKILYRPHPWREPRKSFDVFEPKSYKYTIMDPQVKDDYYGNKAKGTESGSSQNFPELDYYPSLINNALFTISPMSSLILESAIFNVPSLVVAHDDGKNPIPASKQAKYKHFEGAEDIPGWYFAYNLKQLEKIFNIMVKEYINDSPKSRKFKPVLSSAIKKYLFNDGQLYSQRLKEVVDVISSQINFPY